MTEFKNLKILSIYKGFSYNDDGKFKMLWHFEKPFGSFSSTKAQAYHMIQQFHS